ncbi:MAG: hypothetical protein M3P51_03495, partial [Chloroflexota bacterium]|nr:hypothetical protein [Chloroflexota bacterium]
MMPSQIDRAILDLVVEDSYDLMEVVARLRDLLPDESEPEVQQIAQERARQLLTDGLIAVWIVETVGGEEVCLPSHEAEAALAKEGNWLMPTG